MGAKNLLPRIIDFGSLNFDNNVLHWDQKKS